MSSLLALGLLELSLRVIFPGSADVLNNAVFTRVSQQPGQMTELIPGAVNPHFLGTHVRINADGHRGPERAAPVDVLSVGDSVTFGYGVEETAIFHSVAFADARITNLGLPGAGMPYLYHATARWCVALQPKLVLLNVVLNDIALYPDDILAAQPLARARAPADPAAWSHALDRSYVWNTSFHQIKSLLYKIGYLNLSDSPGYRFVALETAGPEVEAAWRSSLKVLDAAVAAVRDCGASPVVTVFPLEVQLSRAALDAYRLGLGVPLSESGTNLEPQARLNEWALASGVKFVDLTPGFEAQEPGSLFLRDKFVSLDPVHPNAEGHRRAGEWLAKHAWPQ